MPRPRTGKPPGRPRTVATPGAAPPPPPGAAAPDVPPAYIRQEDGNNVHVLEMQRRQPRARPPTVPEHLIRMVNPTISSINGPGVTQHPLKPGVIYVEEQRVADLASMGWRVEH